MTIPHRWSAQTATVNPAVDIRTIAVALLLGACALLAPPAAPAQIYTPETDAGVRLKVTGLDEDARDLGTTGASGTRETYVELNPEAHWQASENFAAHTRLQGFYSSGDVVLDERGEPVNSTQYFALRELWLEYGGITDYPGEVLRLGLQRAKDPDGLWWDRDIESVRWLFDTTLLQAHIGVGEEFSNYRSDDTELSNSQRDRAYAFGSLRREWVPGHRGGVRFAFAQDHGQRPEIGAIVDATTKREYRTFAWLGVNAENGFFEYRRLSWMTYWVEATALLGTQENVQTDAPAEPPPPDQPPPEEHVLVRVERDVAALAGDAGLRFRTPGALALQFGGAYAYAQGGRGRDTSNQFEQTGLHSNRSRFTGTRSLIYRFNAAYQAEFTNISVASAFLSLPHEKWDASVILHDFTRNSSETPIDADGIDVRPTAASNDLGRGWDVVVAYYLDQVGTAVLGSPSADDDLRSNLRLRASRFEPGAAYGEGLADQYRVTLELGLWF